MSSLYCACLPRCDSILVLRPFSKVHGVSIATEDTAETAKEMMKGENRKQEGQSLPNGKVDTCQLFLGQSPEWAGFLNRHGVMAVKPLIFFIQIQEGKKSLLQPESRGLNVGLKCVRM